MLQEYQVQTKNQDRLIQSVINLRKKSLIKVLNYLIPKCSKMKIVNFAYSTIGRDLGFCERTIQRAVHELKDLGLIDYQAKFHTMHIYHVNPQIYALKEQLKHKLPSLWSKFIALSFVVLMGNVLPLEKKSFNSSLVSKSIFVRGAHSYASLQERNKNLTKVNRRVVDMVTNKPIISPTLKQITQDLKLTKHGQCKLLAFPDETLQKVWSGTSKEFVQSLPDPFNWIVKRCIEELALVGSEPDWNIYYLLLKTQNVPNTQPFIQKELKKQEPKIGVVLKSSILDRIPEWQNKVKENKILPSYLIQATETYNQNRKEELCN